MRPPRRWALLTIRDLRLGHLSWWAALACLAAGLFLLPSDPNAATSPARNYVLGARTFPDGDFQVQFDPWTTNAVPNVALGFSPTSTELQSDIQNAITQWFPDTARFRFSISERPSPRPSDRINSCPALERFGLSTVTGPQILVTFDHSANGTLLQCFGGKRKRMPSAVTIPFDPWEQVLRREIIVVHASAIPNALTLRNVLNHEFGHAFNLDHSLVETDPQSNGPRPIMTWFVDVAQVRSEEDIVSIADLYPQLPTDHGWIEGRVLNQSDRAQPNVAVIALDARGVRMFSAISRSSLPPRAPIILQNVLGTFRLPAGRGTYKLRFEPIDPDIQISAESSPTPRYPEFDPVELPTAITVVPGRATTIPGGVVKITTR